MDQPLRGGPRQAPEEVDLNAEFGGHGPVKRNRTSKRRLPIGKAENQLKRRPFVTGEGGGTNCTILRPGFNVGSRNCEKADGCQQEADPSKSTSICKCFTGAWARPTGAAGCACGTRSSACSRGGSGPGTPARGPSPRRAPPKCASPSPAGPRGGSKAESPERGNPLVCGKLANTGRGIIRTTGRTVQRVGQQLPAEIRHVTTGRLQNTLMFPHAFLFVTSQARVELNQCVNHPWSHHLLARRA